jgi:hypothetical protein
MGNIKSVIAELQNDLSSNASNDQFERPQKPSEPPILDPELKLAQIRNTNLKTKLDQNKTQQAPNKNTIVEEAVLEDLCEEADLEVDSTKNGPMSEAQKALLLSELATNDRTKHHFENSDQFETFVSEKIHGDIQTANILDIAHNTVQRTNSNTRQIPATESQRSVTSRASQKLWRQSAKNVLKLADGPNTGRISHRDLTTQLRQSRISRMSRNPSGLDIRNMGYEPRRISRMSNKNSALDIMSEEPAPRVSQNDLATQLRQNRISRMSNMHTPDRISKISAMGEPKKISTATAYSLPSDFVSNALNSPMNATDRRKTNTINQTNDKTLQMANELIQRGQSNFSKSMNKNKIIYYILYIFCNKLFLKLSYNV